MLIKMTGGEIRDVPAVYALRLLEQGKAVRATVPSPFKSEAPPDVTDASANVAEEGMAEQEKRQPAKRKAKKESAKEE